MILIAIGIDLLQFITLAGTSDIDDVILNAIGALIMYKVLHVKSINQISKKIFLLESRKLN